MFRTKITLTFVVSVGLLLAGVFLILENDVGRGFEEETEHSLRRAATLKEQSMRLDEFALIEKAQFTASNRKLYRTMRVDEDEDLYERLEEKYEKASNTSELRHLAVYDEPLTVDKIRLQDVKERTENQRNLDLSLYERRPALPELFFVLDENGKGVAALGRDKYRWFGDNVAERHPEVLEAIERDKVTTAVWNWKWNRSDDDRLYRVAIVPIRPTRDKEPAGVVVAGNRISDGYAKRGQRLMSGVTTRDTDDNTVDSGDFESAPDVAFFRGPGIVGSTFSTGEQRLLKKQLFEDLDILSDEEPERLLEIEISDETYVGIVRFFAGEFHENEPATGYVVLSSLDQARQPLARALDNIWLVGGGILLLGIILLLFFVHRFLKPAEAIEDGIGEILAGNKDYTFELGDEAPVFSSIAQGLNLMSAYLQGKPMPDDVEEMEGWGELIGDQPEESGGESKVQGVAMPGMGGSRKEDDDDTDS